MSYSESEQMREMNNAVPAPRFRVNQSTPMTLSTTFQKVDFAGTSTRNTNTFPVGADKLKPCINWDSTNKLFIFNSTVDKNYDVLFNAKITGSAIQSLLNVNLAQVQMRYVVPVPGNPIYFPLPDSDGYVDLTSVGLSSTDRSTNSITIYANSAMRQYGLGLELRISNAFLGGATATLSASDLIIYGR